MNLESSVSPCTRSSSHLNSASVSPSAALISQPHRAQNVRLDLGEGKDARAQRNVEVRQERRHHELVGEIILAVLGVTDAAHQREAVGYLVAELGEGRPILIVVETARLRRHDEKVDRD